MQNGVQFVSADVWYLGCPVIIAVQVHRSRVCSEQKRPIALCLDTTSRNGEHGCYLLIYLTGDF